jgi:hypothetical protein
MWIILYPGNFFTIHNELHYINIRIEISRTFLPHDIHLYKVGFVGMGRYYVNIRWCNVELHILFRFTRSLSPNPSIHYMETPSGKFYPSSDMNMTYRIEATPCMHYFYVDPWDSWHLLVIYSSHRGQKPETEGPTTAPWNLQYLLFFRNSLLFSQQFLFFWRSLVPRAVCGIRISRALGEGKQIEHVSLLQRGSNLLPDGGELDPRRKREPRTERQLYSPPPQPKCSAKSRTSFMEGEELYFIDELEK